MVLLYVTSRSGVFNPSSYYKSLVIGPGMRVNKIHGQDIYFPAGRLRYSSRLTNTGLNNPDHEGSQGYNNIQLSSNYMPLHNMEHGSSYQAS